MSFFKNVFTEKCPTCKHPLVSETNTLPSQIIKSCPHGHYKKESHPALETWIVTLKS